MAERKIEIVISAQDAFTSTLTKAKLSLNSFADGVKGKAEQLVNLKTVSIAAGAALAGLGYEMVKAIQAASEAEAAEKRLTVAMGYRSKALLDQAGALQATTAFEDDAIVGAQALIAAYVKDESQIKAATSATLDLAAAKGMDLQSAAELVAKSLGTETNALARQGVEVEGAIGSAQRLESLTSNISRLFGGQASAQAETFSGKVSQLKNAFDDLQEELGFVITKNAFVIKAVDVLKKAFEGLGAWVNANRLYLMELTKSGILTLVNGIGKAVEVMRFFHNGWLGLKLVGNTTAVVLADSLRIIYEGLRFVLMPLDLMYEGLVLLGAVAVNPFAKISEALGQFQLSSRDVTKEVLKDIEATNAAYDKAGRAVEEFGKQLEQIKVAQAEMPVAKPSEKLPELKEGAVKKEQNTRETAQARLAQLERDNPYNKPYPGSSQAVLDAANYNAKIDALYDYNARVIQAMIDAGKTQAEIEAKYGELSLSMEREKNSIRLTMAANMAAELGNVAQNLFFLLGSKNKAMFEASKAFAIADALIKGFQIVMSAWNEGAKINYYYGIALAASAAVAVAAQVEKIRQTKMSDSAGGNISPSGSSAPSYSGGSSGAYPTPQRIGGDDKPRQDVTINIYNPLSDQNWQKIAEENIIPALNDASNRNISITVRNMGTA